MKCRRPPGAVNPSSLHRSSVYNCQAKAELAKTKLFPMVCFLTISKGSISINTLGYSEFHFSAKNGFVTSLHHSCHQIKSHKKNAFVMQFWPAGFFLCSYGRILPWPGASFSPMLTDHVLCISCIQPETTRYAEPSQLQLPVNRCWSLEQNKYC